MPLPTLNDDLLQSFREEYALVNDQLAILDPLCASLNISAAKRILNNTILILAEFTCYGLFVGGIVLMFMARHLYPLSLIDTIYQSNEITYKLGAPNINSFVIAGYGILLLSSLLFLITGRMASVIRKKNALLHYAVGGLKIISSQQMARRNVLSSMAQRHGISKPTLNTLDATILKKNNVANLILDDEEDEDN